MARKKTTKKDDLKFLSTAKERFQKIELADDHNYEAGRNNLRFVYNIDNGQWAEDVKNERAEDNRPCLTSNKLRKYVAQVANRERDQRLAGNVIPVDDKGDEEKARIISGLIRQIEYASNAEEIYTTAGEHAIAAGFGHWRITTEELDDSFDQEIFIRPIKNQFNVHMDPDGMYGFIREKITKDEFEYRYPKADEQSFDSGYVKDSQDQWYDTDNLVIAEYFYKERVKTEVVKVRNEFFPGESRVYEIGRKYNGETVTEEALMDQGWVVEDRKTSRVFKVKWAKITGNQILERGEWPGKEIPIITVKGDWVTVDGRVYKRSLCEDAKDDQRMYNYWKTNITETVALAIKAPYLVTNNMIKGLKSFWDVAHKKLLPYLPFHPQGKLTPRREPPPQVPTGAATMLGVTSGDIQDTLGLYQSFAGERSNERTGVAIQQRASRSEFGTFHFTDNYRRAILETARQLKDLIPVIYDTPRTVRILGEAGPSQDPRSDLVRINQVVLETGTILNDLTMGKYDVIESVKIMSTRRQEQLQGMIGLVSGNPQLAVLLTPHIARLSDWDGHQQITEEIKQFLPTMLGIQPQDEGQGSTGEGNTGAGGNLL
jgi:hypothetical protein